MRFTSPGDCGYGIPGLVLVTFRQTFNFAIKMTKVLENIWISDIEQKTELFCDHCGKDGT